MTINIPGWTTSKEEADKLVDELSEGCYEYGKDESKEKMLDVFYKTKMLKNYVGIMQGRIELLTARIAELEAEIERLTAHSDIERQDDKWIPVSERLPEGGHREFYEVACIYQDFGELALFSKGRWVIYEGENVYNVTKRVKFWRKRQYLPDEVIAVLSKGEMNPEVQE